MLSRGWCLDLNVVGPEVARLPERGAAVARRVQTHPNISRNELPKGGNCYLGDTLELPALEIAVGCSTGTNGNVITRKRSDWP